MEERYGTYYQPEEYKEDYYSTDGCGHGADTHRRKYQAGAGRRRTGDKSRNFPGA